MGDCATHDSHYVAFRYEHSAFNASTRIMAVCYEKGGIDARLIHASVTALALWWAYSKLPRRVIVPIDGRLFLPGEQGFAKAITLLSFGTTQTCPLVPVMYPPSAAMAGVSTNLGPVLRLKSDEIR
jgi:hypothetical protein